MLTKCRKRHYCTYGGVDSVGIIVPDKGNVHMAVLCKLFKNVYPAISELDMDGTLWSREVFQVLLQRRYLQFAYATCAEVSTLTQLKFH